MVIPGKRPNKVLNTSSVFLSTLQASFYNYHNGIGGERTSLKREKDLKNRSCAVTSSCLAGDIQ